MFAEPVLPGADARGRAEALRYRYHTTTVTSGRRALTREAGLKALRYRLESDPFRDLHADARLAEDNFVARLQTDPARS